MGATVAGALHELLAFEALQDREHRGVGPVFPIGEGIKYGGYRRWSAVPQNGQCLEFQIGGVCDSCH